MMTRERSITLLIALLAALGACGDAPSDDDRQWYTKAPLEDPGLTITAEEPSEMSELGAPDLAGTGAPDVAVDVGGDAAGPVPQGQATDSGAVESPDSDADG
jgi:hypothetical protein